MSEEVQITVVERRRKGCVVTAERHVAPGDIGAVVDALADEFDIVGDADCWIEVGRTRRADDSDSAPDVNVDVARRRRKDRAARRQARRERRKRSLDSPGWV